MLKKLILFTLLTTFISAVSQAQINYNAENIPSGLKNRASAVIRDMQTTVDMRSPENVTLTVKKTITILNKNGNNRAALALFYDKNTSIKSVKGVILNAFGMPEGRFSLNDFADESAVSNFSLFEDNRLKSYLPNVSIYPYTIVYEYEVRFKQNLIIPDWYANPYADVAVEKSSYTFICKPEDQVRIKAYNFKGGAEENKSEKSLSRTWKVSNLSAFKYEPYSPDPDSYLTYVKIAATQFSYYGHKGSYNNWEELGKWVYDDLLKSQQILAPATIEEIKDLVKDIENEKDKVRKIYEYVQKKTRYISVQVGIGGFQPFTAMDVQRLSYGDCKALVNYTQSLLKAVGISSDYCVVNAGNLRVSMDPDFASMDQGNHIILCVPLKSDTTWLECTSQDTPFGYLGTFTDGRTVLACTQNGGKLLKTPVLGTASNLLERKAALTLDADGNISGQLKTELSGSQYDNYNGLVHEPYTEQLKLLKKEYDIDNIDFNNFKLAQKKDNSPVTTETLELTIPNYAPKTNNRVYLIPNIFNKVAIIPEVRNRVLPVYINRGYTDEDQIIYSLPQKYSIEAKPDDKIITSAFGSYNFSVKQEGDKLICNRKLILKNGTYSPEKYTELMSFFSDVSSYDNSKIILKSN